MLDLSKLVDDVAKKKINISDFLDFLVEDALNKKASDIHIEAKEGHNLLIRYRVDGVLRDILKINEDLEESLIFIIKVRAKLRTDIHFAPQDGKILFKVKIEKKNLPKEDIPVKDVDKKEEPKIEEEKEDKEKTKGFAKIIEGIKNAGQDKSNTDDGTYDVDGRISILPVTHGEKVVIRLLSQANRSYALTDLGMSEKDLLKLQKAYKEPYGLILVTGPTGSGKTTTLYSILKILNSREVNITTIEDPVEYSIDGVNHIQINVKGDLTFANGLRSILRQDPNIIMVGEIRDVETARITVNSALTGHLVLSTLHANDAISTIPRLLEMGIEPFLIASTLNIIVTQRLTRRLCEKCKTSYTVGKDKEHAELIKLRPDLQKHISPSDKLYRSVGCKECNNTGYAGRIGIYEVLDTTKDLRDVIINDPSPDSILAVAKKQGFKLMVEDAISKLKSGVIDVKELIKVIAVKE
ncbi:MAG: GspE/PulE family protein [Candidatus Dojkabacteria bacterium]|nr:GspE/PulE family protein [Candidatus Dojkabacteria bacterium]